MWNIPVILTFRKFNASSLIIRLAVNAQPPADELPPPPSTANSYELFSSIDPIVAIGLLILICVFFFVGFFSIYFRLREDETDAVPDGSCNGSRQRGLNPLAMEAFPAFAYLSPEKKSVKRGGGGGDECVICLSDFEKGEKLRQLPRCGHVFHANCIDGWLFRHVTCPVCRAELASELTVESRDGLPNHVVVNVSR